MNPNTGLRDIITSDFTADSRLRYFFTLILANRNLSLLVDNIDASVRASGVDVGVRSSPQPTGLDGMI